MSGDVVLKLDADAARYVAEIVKAADKSKALGKGAKEAKDHFAGAGDMIEAAGAKLGRMVTGAALLATASSAVTKIYDVWVSNLERAEKVSKAIDDRLRGAAGSVGELAKLGSVKDQITGMNLSLDHGERAGAYLAARNAAPGAAQGDLVNSVIAADQGKALGIDPAMMGKSYGKLLRSFGSDAGDAAGMLHQRTGDNASAAVDLLADIGEGGAGHGRGALPLVSSAGRVPGGISAMTELRAKHKQMMIKEGFGDWAQKQSQFMVSPENYNGFNETMRGVGTERDLLASDPLGGNYLSRQSGASALDPRTKARMDTERVKAAAEAKAYERKADFSNRMDHMKAEDELREATTGVPQFNMDRAFDSGVDMLGKTWRKKQSLGDSILTALFGESKKQTQLMQPKPAVGTQGE